jgi:hypothetical protein
MKVEWVCAANTAETRTPTQPIAFNTPGRSGTSMWPPTNDRQEVAALGSRNR